MLVLSRRTSQRIQIGDSIVLTVIKIGGNTVRLGIEAPSDVSVLREELLPLSPPNPAPAETPWATLSRNSRREVFDNHARREYLPA